MMNRAPVHHPPLKLPLEENYDREKKTDISYEDKEYMDVCR